MNKEDIRKIRYIQRSIIALEQQLGLAYGLNMNEAVLLCHLCDRETMLSGEIAETLGLTNSNASKVIASVEKQGYILRKVGKIDRRMMTFTLTPKGRALTEQMRCCDIPVPDLLKSILINIF